MDSTYYLEFKKYSGFLKYFKLLLDPGYILLKFVRLYIATYKLGAIGVLPSRLLWLFVYFLFSCDISPRSKIKGRIIFPHPIGIVIGEGCVIDGSNVIYQGVTLGMNKGCYPQINDVVIYPNSVIAGCVELDGDIVPAMSRVIV